MTLFKPIKADTNDAFLDAVISMTTNDSTTYVGAKAIRNSDVFAAVQTISQDLASNPIELMKSGLHQKNSDLYTLLNVKTGTMDAWHFRFALACNLLLNGNSFAEIVPDGSLTFLKNSQVNVVQDDVSGLLRYKVESGDGKNTRTLGAERILHFKYFTQDGSTGVSPLYSLLDEMKIQKAGNATLAKFFSNGIMPSGMLKVDKSDLDASAKDAIRDKLEQSMTGDNAQRLLVLDSTMTYSPIEVNTDILKLINSNDWSTRQIAKAFGIPAERLGVESEHSSTTQTNLVYIQNTLNHYFQAFTSELNLKLAPDNYYFQFNTENLLSVDPETKKMNLIKMVQGGLMSINEARKELGLTDVVGGDEILISLNYVHLDNMDTYQNNKPTDS